jgi:hypothetical protein
MSSSQNKELLNNHSILPNKDPPEDKTTAIIVVMRGKSKDCYYHHHSYKHYKQKLVRVILDLGSDGNLAFVNTDKPMLLPSSKRLVPQPWNTSNEMFQTKRKAGIELNFFKKGTLWSLILLSTMRIISHSMTSFLALKP